MQLQEWKGAFGREYSDRNAFSVKELDDLYERNFGLSRTELNKKFLNEIKPNDKILEVGSNIGNQLICLQEMGFKSLYGIEPQFYAVERLKKRTEGINIIRGDAFDIPFKNKFFDVVFTSGVLIHINPKDIKKAMYEIYRCSSLYIWGYEYYSEDYKDIMYRGKKGLLWKANFPKMYQDLFPSLKLVKIEYIKYIGNTNVDVMFLLKKQ